MAGRNGIFWEVPLFIAPINLSNSSPAHAARTREMRATLSIINGRAARKGVEQRNYLSGRFNGRAVSIKIFCLRDIFDFNGAAPRDVKTRGALAWGLFTTENTEITEQREVHESTQIAPMKTRDLECISYSCRVVSIRGSLIFFDQKRLV
jgi:hypothetical protein